MSWNTVRPGMSVSSKNTDPYRGISAPRYALFRPCVGISHTLLPKPIRSVYEKLNVAFGTLLVDLIEYPSRGIMIFTSLVNILLVVYNGRNDISHSTNSSLMQCT